MKSVLVLGAGKVGKSVAELLPALGMGNFRVTVADRDDDALQAVHANLTRLRARLNRPIDFAARRVDVADPAAIKSCLSGHDYVICMLPFNFVAGIAEAADELGIHYFDVTEDVATTDRVRAMGSRARVALVPQCGLAPGYINIAAHDIARAFDELHNLTLRVGALPQFPTNALKYNITWSAAGVVNEYCEPCNVMLGGRPVQVPALEGLEGFSFEGVEYEAFYTSGGVGSLIDTLTAEKRTTRETTIAYKTIRYPGHCTLMKFLLQDLRLGAPHQTCPAPPGSPAPAVGGAPPKCRATKFDRAMAVELLEHALARTVQDVVVLFINCIGVRGGGGRREQVNFRRCIRATELFGRVWPAIELTTAAGVCAMVDLHRQGKLARTGFIRQEDCRLEQFNQTLFGLAYEDPSKIEAAVLGGT